MEAIVQATRVEKRNRFFCRDHQTPIFISDGMVACGRENDHCWLKTARGRCPYKEETEKGKREIKVSCPHNSQKIITFNLNENMVVCVCFQEMVKSSGCQSGGCFLLGPHSLNICPFEKTGQINSRG